MVLLPRIHISRHHYWFLYGPALIVVLDDTCAIVLVIEYVLVLDVSYLEPPAIVLTEDTESLCWMLFDR